ERLLFPLSPFTTLFRSYLEVISIQVVISAFLKTFSLSSIYFSEKLSFFVFLPFFVFLIVFLGEGGGLVSSLDVVGFGFSILILLYYLYTYLLINPEG